MWYIFILFTAFFAVVIVGIGVGYVLGYASARAKLIRLVRPAGDDRHE